MKMFFFALLPFLTSMQALAADYECQGENGSRLVFNSLPYMITVFEPRLTVFQFVTHGQTTRSGQVSLIGMRAHGQTTNEEVLVDAGLLKDEKNGSVFFRNESFRCKQKPQHLR